MKEEFETGEQGENPSEDTEVVAGYTRAQAIEDGVLVDVSEVAREAGIKYEVAVTSQLWAEVIVLSEHAKKQGQSESGRLWDVLWMLRVALRASRARRDTIHYAVLVREGKRAQEVEIKAICRPGDNGRPAVTIMLSGEV